MSKLERTKERRVVCSEYTLTITASDTTALQLRRLLADVPDEARITSANVGAVVFEVPE